MVQLSTNIDVIDSGIKITYHQIMNVEIITIGDELLIGQVVDTNSAWMGEQLNSSGFDVTRKVTISDRSVDIKSALESALGRVDIVLLTGGLGPTRDDITKNTLADFFNTKLIYNSDVFEDIKIFLKNRSQNSDNLNREQAMVPESCEVIRNSVGTAPIMWFEVDNKVIVSMPGVPLEMKTAMTGHIIPRLIGKYTTTAIIHKTLLTYGIPEPVLSERLCDFEDKLPDNLNLAYLPSPGRVRLRLSARGNSKDLLKDSVENAADEMAQIIGEGLWGYDNDKPEILIGNILKKREETLACAESCTGGNIAHLITSVAGSSSYFMGGVVAYDNSIKENVLNVGKDDLDKYGAVSREVVEQMAQGVRDLMKVDWAVATSGVAGPSGGSVEKPVGTVWIAWAGPDGVESRKFRFENDRGRNIIRSTDSALIGLLERLRT